jgi:elongation factor Ts
MSISIEDIKRLKELSGIGLTDAKTALVEAEGDFDKALEALRKKGLTKAEKKGDREALEGVIESYVHDGRIGVLVEVNSETDFVARLDTFKAFAHDVALQIAALAPQYISNDDIPVEEMERVRSEALNSDSLKGKPADIADKIVDGQVKKYFEDKVLLTQTFYKNEDQTIADYLKENIAIHGENIVIRQFKRIELGVSE